MLQTISRAAGLAAAGLIAGWMLSGNPAVSQTTSNEDAPTSPQHQQILRELDSKNTGDGAINFALLKQTELNRKPPPVYPDSLKALDGKEITIFGFMTPYDSLTDMRNMMLMPSSQGCQFCAPPSPKEVLFIRRNEKEKQPYIAEPIQVKGVLDLWKDGSEEEMHSMFLYVVNDAVITPLSELEDRG